MILKLWNAIKNKLTWAFKIRFRFSERFVSSFSTSIADQGCNSDGKFAIIAHGWMEGLTTPWISLTVNNLLKYRGGCVFLMDYSKFANVSDYFTLTPHFAGISAVLLKKFRQIGHFENQYCFGFSFGSRLCIDAGLKLGNQSIGLMEVCDPAGKLLVAILIKYWKHGKILGPGFDNTIDPTPAAKNIACIHTSNDKGTMTYNCHQNFRMGLCGFLQAAAGSYPLGSHGLCPYFYNLAFTNEYVPNNAYGCLSTRLASVTSDVRMGYMGNFNR